MSDIQPMGRNRIRQWWVLTGCLLSGLVLLLVWEIHRTEATRGAVRSFSELLSAANRSDLPEVRRLCSRSYRANHEIREAPGGGIVGLPRNIHKNFRTWEFADAIWICPTNRVGPIYRMILEGGAWKFDGLVGQLLPNNRIERAENF